MLRVKGQAEGAGWLNRRRVRNAEVRLCRRVALWLCIGALMALNISYITRA